MARKTRASSTRSRSPEAPVPPAGSPRDRIIDALMALAAERRWSEIELPGLAEQAGVSLAELRDHFPSKGAVLGAFSRRIDKQVLEGNSDDLMDEPVHERVFDVMMRRIDALSPYKEALRHIVKATRGDALFLAALNQVALNSQRFMLAAAGVDTEGPLGTVKLQGAVLVFARTLDVWFRDDDPGLARTMAALDKELRRGGRLMRGLGDVYRLTTPFRGLCEAAAESGRRFRARERATPPDRRDGDLDAEYGQAV
jgi:AcrR family transcriptional regulator